MRFAALILAAMLVSCSTQHVTTVTNGVPNLAEVDTGFWRGGQPNKEGWEHLKSLGVTQVIKLNPESESSDAWAEFLGMKVIRVPVSFSQQMGLARIPDEYFTDAIRSVQGAKTFVHCQHGQDRTGIFVGLYRIKIDGWTKHFARNEMDAHGFHPELIGLTHYWEEQ